MYLKSVVQYCSATRFRDLQSGIKRLDDEYAAVQFAKYFHLQRSYLKSMLLFSVHMRFDDDDENFSSPFS